MKNVTSEFLSSAIVGGVFMLLLIIKTVTVARATNQLTPRKWVYFKHGEIYSNGSKAFQKIAQNRFSVGILFYSILTVVFFIWHYISFGAFW